MSCWQRENWGNNMAEENIRFNLSFSQSNLTSKFAIEKLKQKGRKKAQYISDAIYYYEMNNKNAIDEPACKNKTYYKKEEIKKSDPELINFLMKTFYCLICNKKKPILRNREQVFCIRFLLFDN